MEFSDTDAIEFVRRESRKHLKLLAYVIGIGTAAIAFPAVNSFMIQDFINALGKGSFSSILAIVILGLVLLAAFFDVYHGYVWKVTMKEGAKILAGEVYDHVQSLPMSYFRSNSTGTIIAKVLEDTDITGQSLMTYYSMLFLNLFQVAISGVVLLLLDWELALVAFTAFPISFLLIGKLNMKQRKSWEKERTGNSKKVESVREKVDGIEVIKGYNRGEFFKSLFRTDLNGWFGALKSAVFYGQISKGILRNAASILSVAILIVGAFLATKRLTTFGSVIAFFWYVGNLYGPIEGLADWNNSRQQIIPMGKRILSVLAMKPEIDREGRDLPERPGAELSGISFGYDGKKVLHSVSLKFEGSKMSAVVGESGCGKSTLVSLLTGFNDPSEGEVSIGGTDIGRYSTKAVRDSISVVNSKAFLFNLSIRDNITLGKEYTEEEIVGSAEIAGIHGFITTLPDRYDTVVMENGTNFSEGQRQRIAVARAVIRRPKILILDEATSGVDSKTESAIYEKLRALGTTLIVIAHRLSTIHMADGIFVLEGGKVTCEGKHADLLENCPVYRKIFEKQLISE